MTFTHQFAYGKTMTHHSSLHHMIAMFFDKILSDFLHKIGHIRSIEHQSLCWYPVNGNFFRLQRVRNNSFDGSTNDTSLHLYFINRPMRITINEITNFFNMFSCCLRYRPTSSWLILTIFPSVSKSS